MKLVSLSPPCSLVQIMCTDVSGIVSWEPRFPLYPAPNFCHGKWCVPPGTSLEKSRRNISPSYSSGLETAGFSHVLHTVRITPHYTFLLVQHSLQLKSGWISDGLSWAQGEIEYGANKPCSDSHSPSWILVGSCFFFLNTV